MHGVDRELLVAQEPPTASKHHRTEPLVPGLDVDPHHRLPALYPVEHQGAGDVSPGGRGERKPARSLWAQPAMFTSFAPPSVAVIVSA